MLGTLALPFSVSDEGSLLSLEALAPQCLSVVVCTEEKTLASMIMKTLLMWGFCFVLYCLSLTFSTALLFDFCYSRSKGSKFTFYLNFLSAQPHFLNLIKPGLYIRFM